MDLTPDQAAKLRDAVRGRTRYFHAVRVRLHQLGIGPGDRLFDLFAQAEAALRQPSDELHGMAVTGDRRPWEPGGAGCTSPD